MHSGLTPLQMFLPITPLLCPTESERLAADFGWREAHWRELPLSVAGAHLSASSEDWERALPVAV
jgi:hypothetical protein